MGPVQESLDKAVRAIAPSRPSGLSLRYMHECHNVGVGEQELGVANNADIFPVSRGVRPVLPKFYKMR